MTENLRTINIKDRSDKQLEIVLKAFNELSSTALMPDQDQPLASIREQIRRRMLEKLGMVLSTKTDGNH